MRRGRRCRSACNSVQQSVGADAHIGPFVRIHRTSSVAVTLQLCLRRPTFSAASEKVGKKRRLGTRHIAR